MKLKSWLWRLQWNTKVYAVSGGVRIRVSRKWGRVVGVEIWKPSSLTGNRCGSDGTCTEVPIYDYTCYRLR